ncbi:hypothetical protein B5X24_HaOG211724 [Helicoverpa armigera]|nr:hypothetical protein B5X24_HaOG211724 [Helicoverpa armigera]
MQARSLTKVSYHIKSSVLQNGALQEKSFYLRLRQKNRTVHSKPVTWYRCLIMYEQDFDFTSTTGRHYRAAVKLKRSEWQQPVNPYYNVE